MKTNRSNNSQKKPLNKQLRLWLAKLHLHVCSEEVPIAQLWLLSIPTGCTPTLFLPGSHASCGCSHSCQFRQLESGIGFAQSWRCYSLTKSSDSTQKYGRCLASGIKTAFSHHTAHSSLPDTFHFLSTGYGAIFLLLLFMWTRESVNYTRTFEFLCNFLWEVKGLASLVSHASSFPAWKNRVFEER